MNPRELIRAGKLSEAREQLTAAVKASPSDVSLRVLLFQVLCFYGEWDKAERHLDVIVSCEPGSETGAQVYKSLINAERERGEVVARKRIPGFLTGTPAYLELYFAAWEKVCEKKIDEADCLYRQLADRRPVAKGVINGNKFSGFEDTDTFLSGFLEGIVHDRYIWFPFESLRELSIAPPKTLFDLLWTQAQVVTRQGLAIGCCLPVLYPGSSLHADDRVRLGRMTEWKSLGGTYARGCGQHVYAVDGEEMAILDLRKVSFEMSTAAEKS